MNSLKALPVTRQTLSRHSAASLWILIGAALAASPFAEAGIARPNQAGPASDSASSVTVQADVTPAPTQRAAADLLLAKSAEQSADALAAYSEGLAAEDKADNEGALDAYRRSVRLDPGNTELAAKVAFEIARRGDVAQGINILKDAAKAAPKSGLPPLCLSQMYDKFLKKPELAERYALAAQALDPESFGPFLALADIYASGNQPKKLFALVERAARSSSSDPLYWLQLGELQVRLTLKPEGAVTAAAVARCNPLFEKALACAKDNTEVMGKVADYYVATKQVKAAIPLYLRVIELSQGASSEELLGVRDKLARSLLASGQRDQAIAVLEQMVKDAPARYETYEFLGQLYALNSQLQKAIGNYQQALLIDPTQALNYLRIADLQLQLRKPEDAVKTLAEAHDKFPELPQVTYSLAIALSQAKQHLKAISFFEEALQEAKNSGNELLTATFYFEYGAAAEQAGDLDRAVKMLRKSIELSPAESAQACNYLGFMWVDRGMNLEEAGGLIKRALSLDPKNGAYLDSLGWYYFKTGKFDDALTSLRLAAERLEPADPEVYDHMGEVYAAMGNVGEAINSWKKALALDPDSKSLPEKISKAQRKLAAVPMP